MSSSFTTTPPSAPASGTSRGPWRVAIVVVVAALAVAIGVAAASFIATSRVAAVGGAAGYVPASAPLYLEMRVEPSASQDEALRELLARFPPIDGLDLDRPLSEQLADMLDEVFVEEGLDLRWDDDVSPWFDGRVAIALLELPPASFDPTFNPSTGPASVDATPSMLVLVGVTDADAARASVQRQIEAHGEESTSFTVTEHRGVAIHVADGSEAGAYAVTDDQLLLAPTADDIVAALDIAASGTTLAERDEITRLVEALPSDWLAFGVFDFSDAMAAALEAGGDESSRATSAALSQILEHQSMRSAFTVTARGDGLSFDSVSEPPTGPFATRNAVRGLADEVPGDSLYYAEGGNIGPALAAIIGAIKEAASAEPEAAEGVRTAEAALGADLEELFTWIGDGAVSIGFDGSDPYGGMVLVPDDRAAAERRLGQLATFAGLAGMDPGSGVSVDEDEIGDVTVTTIRWVDPGMLMMPTDEATALVIQYALTDDRVLIGIGDSFVQRALELDPGEALSAQPRYADAVAELGGPDGTAIGWMDLSGTLLAVEQAVGPMLVGDEYRSEIRPWLTPFDRVVSVGRIEGDVLVQRSVLLVE